MHQLEQHAAWHVGVCDSAWAISGAPVSVLCTCVWLFPLGYDVTRYLLCFHSDVRLSGGLLFSGFDVATRRALVIARLPNVAAGGWGRQTVGSETAGRLNGSAISPGERVRAIRSRPYTRSSDIYTHNRKLQDRSGSGCNSTRRDNTHLTQERGICPRTFW